MTWETTVRMNPYHDGEAPLFYRTTMDRTPYRRKSECRYLHIGTLLPTKGDLSMKSPHGNSGFLVQKSRNNSNLTKCVLNDLEL